MIGKFVFHVVGLSCGLVSCVWVFLMFVGVVLGGSVRVSEPNLVVLGVEVGLFGFSMVYAGWSLKDRSVGVLKKMVWERQKKEFYK